jgi:omega-amidase
MKAALLQLNSVWESPRDNYDRAAGLLAAAAGQGCDLAVLPEMFPTGTSSNTAVTAEPDGGPTQVFLSESARRHRMHIIAGLALRGRGSKARNCAAVYDRKGVQTALYTKLYPFSPALEHRQYEAGDAPVAFALDGAGFSVFICYDLRFPEAFRSIAKKIQAAVVIANWPRSRVEHWEALLRARAIENQCFVIGVNRTGVDGNGLYYPGCSQIIDPWGKLICRGAEREPLVTGEFDPADAARYRAKYGFLQDMKPAGFYPPDAE